MGLTSLAWDPQHALLELMKSCCEAVMHVIPANHPKSPNLGHGSS